MKVDIIIVIFKTFTFTSTIFPKTFYKKSFSTKFFSFLKIKPCKRGYRKIFKIIIATVQIKKERCTKSKIPVLNVFIRPFQYRSRKKFYSSNFDFMFAVKYWWWWCFALGICNCGKSYKSNKKISSWFFFVKSNRKQLISRIK